MSGTDIREALKEVGAATRAPAQDRVAFQQQVRRERRSRAYARGGVGLAVAAATAVLVASALPFLQGSSVPETSPTAPPGASSLHVELDTPIYFVADGMVTALDPQGGVHDLGLRSEEVIGWTSEFVYAYGPESEVVRFDVHNSEEGPGGPWEFDRVDSGIPGAVQGADLSADGRWLGWIDLDDRLTVRDLKAGTDTGPVDVPRNSSISDLAQGTGAPLVSENGDLVLRTPDGPVAIPTPGGYGVVAQATRDLVAVMDRDDQTRIYDVSSGTAKLADVVPGSGVLSPYGEHLVSITLGKTSSRATLWSAGEGRRLPVPGPAAVRGLGRRRHSPGDDVRRAGDGALRVRGGRDGVRAAAGGRGRGT